MQASLPNLLIELVKQGRIKKIPEADAKAVAYLLHRDYSHAVIPAACDVAERRLGYAGYGGKLIDGDAPVSAQLMQAVIYCTADTDPESLPIIVSHINIKGFSLKLLPLLGLLLPKAILLMLRMSNILILPYKSWHKAGRSIIMFSKAVCVFSICQPFIDRAVGGILCGDAIQRSQSSEPDAMQGILPYR